MQIKSILCFFTMIYSFSAILGNEDLHLLSPEAKNFWVSQNHMSPMETAGAHGLKGFHLGTGLSMTNTKNGELIPKLWITKGLTYPLDTGISLASSSQKKLDHFGVYLQYTFFEAFARPAFALRLKYSELYDQAARPDLKTYGTELVGSWGVGSISAYGTLGYDLNRWDQAQEGFMQNTLGVQFQIISHLVKLCGEGIFQGTSPQLLQTKLSIGI